MYVKMGLIFRDFIPRVSVGFLDLLLFWNGLFPLVHLRKLFVLHKIVYNQIPATITQEILSSPKAKVPKTGSPIFYVCDGPKYLYKFMTLPPKDYYLIPSNNGMKLVCVFLSYCID